MTTDSHTRPQTPLAEPVHAIEQAGALDPLVDVGNRVSGLVVSDDAVRKLLQGAWLGHALHPLLVEVPIGTWMSASLLDVAGDDSSRDDAQLLTGVGLLAAVPAALSGWAEYAETDTRSRRVAVVHAGANALGIGLQVASFVARRGGHHRLGAALGLGALSAVGAGGFLGGHLAAARKVGTHDPSFGPAQPALES